MPNSKGIKEMQKIVRPYGLTVARERGHVAIRTKDGKRVGTMSQSPKDPQFVVQNTLKQLVQNRALPERAWQEYMGRDLNNKHKNY